MSNIYENLTMLGSNVPSNASTTPESFELEKVKNPSIGYDYTIRLSCPEFTSICPITGQPDFAQLVIDYVPDKFIVESKSFKLFLCTFRNHGAFHEECTLYIAKKLIEHLEPKFLRIGGYWYPRGGIPIDIFFQHGQLPENIWLPEQGISTYRAR